MVSRLLDPLIHPISTKASTSLVLPYYNAFNAYLLLTVFFFRSRHRSRSTLTLSALESRASPSEARPNMVRKVSPWTEIIVRVCLEGMGGLDEEEASGLEV